MNLVAVCLVPGLFTPAALLCASVNERQTLKVISLANQEWWIEQSVRLSTHLPESHMNPDAGDGTALHAVFVPKARSPFPSPHFPLLAPAQIMRLRGSTRMLKHNLISSSPVSLSPKCMRKRGGKKNIFFSYLSPYSHALCVWPFSVTLSIWLAGTNLASCEEACSGITKLPTANFLLKRCQRLTGWERLGPRVIFTCSLSVRCGFPPAHATKRRR